MRVDELARLGVQRVERVAEVGRRRNKARFGFPRLDSRLECAVTAALEDWVSRACAPMRIDCEVLIRHRLEADHLLCRRIEGAVTDRAVRRLTRQVGDEAVHESPLIPCRWLPCLHGRIGGRIAERARIEAVATTALNLLAPEVVHHAVRDRRLNERSMEEMIWRQSGMHWADRGRWRRMGGITTAASHR